MLGELPGKIAAQREHPQAEAIRVAGWLGLITLGVLWPFALIWAFVQGLGAAGPLAESLCLYGLIPGDLLGTVTPGTRQPVSDFELGMTFDMGGAQ